MRKLRHFGNMRRTLSAVRHPKLILKALSKATYDLAAMEAQELRKFEAEGLDLKAGLERLNEVLAEIKSAPFDQTTGEDSVHWLLFACLSLTDWGREVRDILEIGTFRGKTTRILRKLFPQAQILTVDLPDDDPILETTYRRDTPEAIAEYKARRDANTSEPGVRFVARNSFFLPDVSRGPFDLIWLDGGHLYPEVAWDLCNAYHSCRRGGTILCDDVYTHPKGGDGIYGNRDCHEAITYIAARARLSPQYFLKRLNPEWSASIRDRKYVAMLRLR